MFGLAALAGAADAGQDEADDLFAQGQWGGDGARGGEWGVVAAVAAGLVDDLFAAEFAEVVGALPDGVGLLGLPGHGVHLFGELGHGEPVGSGGQGQDSRQRCA